MGQASQQPAPTTPEDPLADLREDDAPGPTPDPAIQGNESDQGAEEAECGEVRPMVSQEVLDEMVTEAVVAFHTDPTSQGFLHGGGQCGCRYIARVALQAAVPVAAEGDLEDRELEAAHE